MSTKKKASANLMYLGPTIAGVTRHSTIYKNGVLPSAVNECIQKFPAMQKLFVTMNELPVAAKELQKEQSALVTIYGQVAKKFK